MADPRDMTVGELSQHLLEIIFSDPWFPFDSKDLSFEDCIRLKVNFKSMQGQRPATAAEMFQEYQALKKDSDAPRVKLWRPITPSPQNQKKSRSNAFPEAASEDNEMSVAKDAGLQQKKNRIGTGSIQEDLVLEDVLTDATATVWDKQIGQK